jgi:hypothetical protein
MVNAYAGCAKTTTLELAAQKIKVPALALAFNARIAREMKGRLPGNFSTKTMNGLGYGAWARALPAVAEFTLDEKKLFNLISQTMRDFKVSLDSDQWDGLRRMATRAMQVGIVPTGHGPDGLLPDNEMSWRNAVAEPLGIFDGDFEMLQELAHEIIVRDIALARAGTISFDDQIYCSTLLGGRFPKFPVVFVDEAQDLSPLNHRMLALAMRDDAKLVSVGDDKQAIYAWRGAHGRSSAAIRALRARWQDHDLATTFRCPKTIVARNEHHAPGFKAWHTNADGQYVKMPNFDPAAGALAPGWGWPDIAALAPQAQSTIAVLCRNNAPIFSLALKLLRRRIGITILGRDIGKSLVVLSRKLFPEDGLPADACSGLLADWELSETSKALANGQDEKVAGIIDRADCLRAVLSDVRDAGQLRDVIAKLFAKDSAQVTLGSIHRAKGLEWDVVVHLDPWRVPSKWARRAAKDGDDVPLEQEYNLIYVVETRTKHTLVSADLDSFR